MATLEVHDDQGRVQFIELARDHPALFGTSVTCDVVLSGEGVRPVHGRIIWKKHRFKIEASPDAQFVEVNGTKMATSSLHQGDEVGVGPCRIYIFRIDDDLEPAPGRQPARRGAEQATQVLERVGPPAAPRGDAGPGRGRDRGDDDERTRVVSRPAKLESPAWMDDLKVDGAGTGGDEGPGGPGRRPSRARAVAGEPRKGLRAWLEALRDGRPDAPGRERLISSPLVIGLIVALVALVGLGIGLRVIILKTQAEHSFNHAVEEMEDGDYRTAIRDFDAFLASFPEDPRAGRARVFRAMSNVRQYMGVSGGTWSTALEAAREMLSTVGGEEAFRDSRPELAELVIRIGEGLADRSRRAADEKSLREAESAVPLHAEIAGEPAPAFLKKSRLPDLLNEARAAVRKSQVRAASFLAMDNALREGSASGVYAARDALVAKYADLAHDPELVRRMAGANDLVKKAVKLDPTRRAAAIDERPEVLGPATTLVLRSSNAAAPAGARAADSLAFGLADGIAYAVDSGTGAPLWQRPVGLSAPFAPMAVAGDPSVLVADARHDELLRLEAATGKLIWRLPLGGPIESPPLVLGNDLFQTLPGGKLAVISLQKGEIHGTLELGLPLAQSAVSDEQGRFLYLLARRDCLFTLSREPLACLGVEYLGHEEGSIPCSPVRVGRYLVVSENDRPTDSVWRVMVLEDEGAKVRPVQRIDVAGWQWGTPASSGSVLWATGDRGGVEAFALGDYSSDSPLRSLARTNPDATSGGPAFGLSFSERELWLGGVRSGRYDLDAERGQVGARVLLGQIGPATGPLQAVAGRSRVIVTTRDPATGGTLLCAVDAKAGSIAWRTVLGARWPTDLSRTAKGDGLKTVGEAGAVDSLPRKRLESGGFEILPISRPGARILPAGRLITLDGPGDGVEVIAPDAGGPAVWVHEPGKPGGEDDWRKVELPSAPASPPLAWGANLLVPGGDGRVYLIDPISAESRAEPFVPVYDRDRRGRWLAPAPINAGSAILADDTGRVRRLALKSEPTPRLVVEAESSLDKGIVSDPAVTEGAVIVATADGKVRALSIRDLSPVGSWALPAPLVERPVTVAGRCFLADAAGGVLALLPDGRRAWSVVLDSPALGAPLVSGDTAWFLGRNGTLEGRSLADGSLRRKIHLETQPAGGLLQVGGLAMIPVARGTLRTVNLDATTGGRP